MNQKNKKFIHLENLHSFIQSRWIFFLFLFGRSSILSSEVSACFIQSSFFSIYSVWWRCKKLLCKSYVIHSFPFFLFMSNQSNNKIHYQNRQVSNMWPNHHHHQWLTDRHKEREREFDKIERVLVLFETK